MNTPIVPDRSASETRIVTVKAQLLRDLADTYTLYEQAVVDREDPVRMLRMTGDVLAAVRRVVTHPMRGITR